MLALYLCAGVVAATLVRLLWRPRPKNEVKIVGDQAVIIGCGIAGMLVAKSLSKKFKKVVILERDALANSSEPRRGVPQSTQYHAVTKRGFAIMEKLFPGLSDDLRSQNCAYGDFCSRVKFNTSCLLFLNKVYMLDGWFPRSNSDLHAISCSRALLEKVLRKKLQEQTLNVEIREKSSVLQLLHDSDTNTVLGVRVSDKRVGSEYELLGDFVVDCGGANSRNSGIHLLKEIGIEAKVHEVDAGVGYTSGIYKFEKEKPEFLAMFVMANPLKDQNIGVVMGMIEDETYHFNWYSYCKDYPPATDEEIAAYTKRMRVSDASYWLSKATRISPLVPYRNVNSQKVCLDEISNFPERYIMLGDSVAHFTPVYAQGMTFASLCVEELFSLIVESDGNLLGLSQKYNKAIKKHVDLCWTTSAGSDFAAKSVKSNTQPPPGYKFINSYIQHVQQSIIEDPSPELYIKLMKVMQMILPGYALFAPAFVFRVVKLYIRELFKKKV